MVELVMALFWPARLAPRTATALRDMTGTRPIPLIAAFVLALALFAGVAWSDWYYMTRGQQTQQLVSRSREVQTALARLLARVEDIETGARGFVITGDASFLEPFMSSMATVEQQLETVRSLSRGNPLQQAQCDALKGLIARRVALAQTSVDLRRTSGFEAARQNVAGGAGKAAMDLIRTKIAKMEEDEESRLGGLLVASRHEARTAEAIRVSGTGVGVVLFIATFALVLRENGLRQRSEHELLQLNRELDRRVQERTAELELERATLSAAFENMDQGVVIASCRGGDIVFNAAAVRMHGFASPRDVHAHIGDYASDWEITDSHGRLVPYSDWPLPRAIRGDYCRDWEAHLRHLQSGYEWDCSYSCVPVRNAAGDVSLIVVTLVDITERKRALETLRASEALFATAFKASPDAIAISRLSDRRIIEANDAWQGVFGFAPEEVIGRTADELDLLPQPTDRDRGVSRLLADGYVRDVETLIRRASGEVRQASISAATIVVGGDPCILSIVRDITDWKRAETEIRRLYAELEHRVEERTRQLQEANQELESFSYSVSHDLRAPLRHVHGYVEMLHRATNGQLSDQARRYLNIIGAASVEMGQLIDDLLAFSRVGRTPMATAAVRLDDVVREVIQGLEMATRDRPIVWLIPPLPVVTGDPALLKQVLANLVGNAVKYSRDRNPARIEIGRAGEDDGRVVLFVRDNGAGFDMQYAHKLFGVFQRLHRAEEFEGTGVGLATVRRIVTRHGGRVWAEGAPGEGATFYFSLQPSPADSRST